jgi:hypothetical protein
MQPNYLGKYVVVNSSGTVELRSTAGGGPIATFGHDAQLAMMSGDVIQVNLKNGKVIFYKLSSTGYAVSGPYITL